MAKLEVVDWDALIRDPRFQSLHRRKSVFLWGLMMLGLWEAKNLTPASPR